MLKNALKQVISRSLWHVLGRKNMVRFAQFLSNEARLDSGAQECGYGDQLILSRLGEILSKGEPRVCLDIGANIGEWTRGLMNEAQSRGASVSVHAFEPCDGTYSTLIRNFDTWGIVGKVKIHKLALSAEECEKKFYSRGDNAGSNSVYSHKGMYENSEANSVVTVPCTTIDRFCEREGIRQVLFVKIDAEGHDYEVMAGAKEMLKAGRIDMLQFEYNDLWVSARRFLLDAFELLQPLNYALGKITVKGVEFYDRWDSDLERFGRGGNFLVVKSDYRTMFPIVKWWKDA